MEKELDCEYIRINPDGKEFVIYIEIGKIYNHIKESNKKLTKKSIIDKISKRISELKFNSSRLQKYVVKKNTVIIIKHANLLFKL